MAHEVLGAGWDDLALAGLLDAAPDALVVVDESGTIVLVNAQVERLFGYCREDLLGRSVDMLVPQARRAAQQGHREAYLANPTARRMGEDLDLRGRRKDGSEFPAEVTISPVPGQQDSPRAGRRARLVCAAIRDVTRKQREERLFRGLLEAAPDAMVIVDVDGRIVLVNAQAERLFGYRREELVGRSAELLVPERFAGLHAAYRSGYVTEPRTRPMGLAGDLHARRRDGSEFPVEISLAPLETDDGLLVSAAVRDTSERRRGEEEANRVKDEFFAAVSHELRTPLTSIIGYAEIMDELEALSPYGKRFLSVIRRSAQRELRLVNDLLTIVAIEDSGLAMQIGELDLEGVVREAVEAIRPSAEEASLELSLETPGFAVPMSGDRDRLGQALDNLLSNAVKFSPEGGRIRVVLRVADGRAEVDVIDGGPGIGDVEPERLFERLYRAADAVHRQVPGAGLGLAIARAIAEAHDGTITVVQSGPQGTTFRLAVPL
ncbi:MAG TPA: PAS domain S-box protein [Marmoricola sp.]|nr:PAS domain S-box protein [Marmoricola sp.]